MEVATPTITLGQKIAVVLVSAAIHHAMYLGSGIFSKRLFDRFGFTYADQRSWRSRCTSMLHAFIVGGLGAYVLFVEKKLDMEQVWPATNLSVITMAISAGYFLWDSIVVLARYDLFGFLFALHGIYCLYVYAIATFYVVFHYHAMALLMFEWSTPFMNIFFMADQVETKMQEAAALKSKQKTDSSSEKDVVDGVPKWFKTTTFVLSALFALAFVLVRMVWGNYHYFQFYRVCWALWNETPVWLNLSLMALIIVAFLLNGTWMVQIILTGLNVLPKPDSNTKPIAKDGSVVEPEIAAIAILSGDLQETHSADTSKSAAPTKSPKSGANGTRSPRARRRNAD
jgi:hypothetical protein